MGDWIAFCSTECVEIAEGFTWSKNGAGQESEFQSYCPSGKESIESEMSLRKLYQ